MNAHYSLRNWTWVMTANFSEGVPYALVNTLMVAMLADLGLGNGPVTMATTLLSLPWAFKFFWSPVVDIWASQRQWMLWMQGALALTCILIAICLPSPWWLAVTLICAGLTAFFSATYDIACDGYYMKALPDDGQAFFVGIRSTAYRLGMLFVTGGLVWIAGHWCKLGYTITTSWSLTLGIAGGIIGLLGFVHYYLLPHAEQSVHTQQETFGMAFIDTIKTFFRKGDLLFMFLFLFTYRLGEAFLSKVTILFLKDDTALGGLALSNQEYGILYGSFGILSLVLGGIIGGIFISKFSLRRCIIPMALALNVPDLLYVWMAWAQPSDLVLIGTFVSIEQLGYGFGFTAYTVYLLQCAKGSHSTAHYAFLTALMAIGISVPTMISGFVQQHLGYTDFFILTCILTLPGIAMSVWYWRRHRPHGSSCRLS